ncbi:hypothetical protein ACR0ST_04220 [Aliidiomarina sp. Khilg15.8]
MYKLNQSQSKALDRVIANPPTELFDALRQLHCSQNPAEEKHSVLAVRLAMNAQVESELEYQGDSV